MTPLTVYRWELPDDAPEARRPRGKIRARLDALAAQREAPLPAATTPPSPAGAPETDELAALAPLLDRLENGELEDAEDALLSLLASGALRSEGARALATQALARAQLWARADARAALTLLLPLLGDAAAGTLPAAIECEVHVTAALVFSALDGRVFDAGKVNAHAARAERIVPAERAGVVRFLLWHARVVAAYVLDDAALLAVVLARAEGIDAELRSPLLRCFADEIRALSGMLAGRFESSSRYVQHALRTAREHRLHLVLARLLSQVARQQADDCVDPDEIESGLAHIDAIARDARIAPSWHSMMAAYAASEASIRAARWQRAEDATREHLRIATALKWAPGTAPLFLARLLLLRGRAGELRAEADRMLADPPRVYAETGQLVSQCVAVIADLAEGQDRSACVDRFSELALAIERAGAWAYLRRNVAIADAAVAVLAGDGAQRARALHRAQQTLDQVPSVWGSGAIEALRGVRALREGRPADAVPALQRALASFELARDRPHAALVRDLLAQCATAVHAPDAGALRGESERELARLGIGPLRIDVAPALAPASRPAAPAPAAADVASLLAAQRRLCVRGMSPRLVHTELLAVLHELFPGTPLRIDELDSQGAARSIAALGELDARPLHLAELGDGSGRRFRVGAALEGEASRDLFASTVAIAELALEVATLRRIGDAPPRSPDAPELAELPETPGLLAASPAMRRLKSDLVRLARSRATVIVTGESGSGKEVIARAIHDLSVRAGKPYVAFNCAAVPRELFEGQLFGYRRGAFTGAVSDQPGVIRAADGGTLFLDEIAELPLDVQPKLLRFLENGEIFPLGERRPVHVDVRVVAATFRDLEQLVRERRFREDLFYRLQVVPLRVPPLRERPEDVAALALHFVRTLSAESQARGAEPPVLAPDAIAALLAHPWPGNVRELRNVLERTLAFDPLPPRIGAEHLRFG